jgi:beta-carotene hydroxylase
MQSEYRNVEGDILKFSEKPLLDLPTLALFLLMGSGQFLITWAIFSSQMNPIVGFIFATLLMNLSFTIWHECSHRNFSRIEWISDFFGAIGSFLALGPSYFHRRNEHIIHHRFEGDPERDPVHPRIQTKLIFFPFRLLSLRAAGKNQVRFLDLMPLSQTERAVDLALIALTTLIIGFSFFFGFGKELVLVWILPRITITLLHAYYICFLPHHNPEGGYVRYRVMPGLVAQALTINQNLHGVHHMFPFRPWHQYPNMLKAIAVSSQKNELEVK